MADQINMRAEKRDIIGRKVKSLRNDGFLPAVLYGHSFDTQTIKVDSKDFDVAFKKAGHSTIVYLDLGDQNYPTIIQDVHRDPVSDKYLHADFYKVRLDEKITATIPLVITGESSAVKNLAGILVKNISEIEVEALPQDLPHEIEVDISTLNKFDDHITIQDLKVSDKVEILAKPEDIVVLVQEPISEDEFKAQMEATASVDDVEVIKKESVETEDSEESEGGDSNTISN